MNRWSIVSSITLLAFCLGALQVSAGESLDERPTGTNGSAEEAFESLAKQLRRDPFDKEARNQLIELVRGSLPGEISVEEVDESLEARWVAAALGARDWRIGTNLTAEEAESLEARLDRDPQELETRTHLIIYYRRAYYRHGEVRRVHHRHVLWLIRNAPQAFVLAQPDVRIDPHFDVSSYDAGKDAWLSHIEREPTNVAFLGHAANYLSRYHDRDLIIEYFQKSQSLDPHNPKWPTDLGRLYLLETNREEAGATKAMQALEQFQRAYELSGWELEQANLLQYLGKAAWKAERYDDARTYATQMLDYPATELFGGDQLHHGNLLLGMIALIENDTEQAKDHLLEAGRTPGSPVLASYGPRMDLALQLLRRGERQVVLESFELCSKFWHRDELNDWAAVVIAGGIPDFGSNIDY